MSISEVSNNLFKNYYPCVLPDYYTEQISQQIIDNQIDKLTSNFIKEKNDLMKNKKIKINQNMDYLRQLAEKQGEWMKIKVMIVMTKIIQEMNILKMKALNNKKNKREILMKIMIIMKMMVIMMMNNKFN